jgi:multidrug transporter EmrE-like cation transporter
MVLVCTVIGAAAQVLIKMGTAALGEHPTMMETVVGILTTHLLFEGYALYGLSTVLLVLALRQGELSLLYPVFTLTYVWVTVLSVIIFHDSMNGFKLAGISTIIAGVGVLGRASRQ